MRLWFGNKQTVTFSSHCDKQKQRLTTGRSRSRPGDGARAWSGGLLNALVFRRFYHGSESGVFVCQQGSRAVKLQDLPEGEQNGTEQNVYWHQRKTSSLITQTVVHDSEMRTYVIGEYYNLGYFP